VSSRSSYRSTAERVISLVDVAVVEYMNSRKRRYAALVEYWLQHSSSASTWSTSSSRAARDVIAVNSSSHCTMMTYNLVEPDGVSSLLRVNVTTVNFAYVLVQ